MGRSAKKASFLLVLCRVHPALLTPTTELLTANSTLYIIDKPSKSQDLPIRASTSPQKPSIVTTPRKVAPGANVLLLSPPTSARKALRDLGPEGADASRVDLSRFRSDALKIQGDPLPDEAFIPTHRRAERKEKNLRNIEKEHAMFEKGQLERLLDGLRGPDWLKVMGLTGITDGEKRTFETKRDHFVRGVKSLLRKFDSWKEQERELKFGRDQTSGSTPINQDEQEEDEGAGEETQAEEDEEEVEEVFEQSKARHRQEDNPEISSEADADAPPKQQSRETKATIKSQQQHKAKQTTMDRFLLQFKNLEAATETAPITSFYGKKYLRDGALSERRRGRIVLAFGQPLPEPNRREFELPGDVLSADMLASNARRHRSLKRKASPD